MNRPYVVAALYRFAALPNHASLQAPLRALCAAEGLYGTLLLAEEGINGTVAGRKQGVERLVARLRREPALEDVKVRLSECDEMPFMRLKVRVKREIVTLGIEGIRPRERTGAYVDPQDWNTLLSDPNTVVVDTRNAYEVRIGTFERAINPALRSFREFPQWAEEHLEAHRDRKIAMFCTGGIRCEKASSWLVQRGFSEVYQLEGGILNYLESVPPEDSRWRGECFVFDERVGLDHHLRPGVHVLCYGCKEPVAPQEQLTAEYEFGVSCPRCFASTTAEDKSRWRERARQAQLAAARGERHLAPRTHAATGEEGINPTGCS